TPLDQLSSGALNGELLGQLRREAKVAGSPVVREVQLDGDNPNHSRSLKVTVTPSASEVQMVIEDCSDLRRMEAALARYVSPRVLEAVVTPGLDPYQARKYELSVLFADLRGFTAIASASSAEEVKKLIDEYLTVQIDIVFREGATLDKIVGDEVMVLFGAPLPA